MSDSPQTSDPLVFLNAGVSADPAPSPRIIGRKAAGLAGLIAAGAPVPSGFVLTTGMCETVLGNGAQGEQALRKTLEKGLAQLTKWSGRTFAGGGASGGGNGGGDGNDSLLVSVRSSSPAAMPGTIGTIINLGLTETGVKALAKKTGDARFAWDAYRRFLQGFAVNVLQADPVPFQSLLDETLERERADGEHELDAKALETLAKGYKELCEANGSSGWLKKPEIQIFQAARAGFKAWENSEARAHRLARPLDEAPGTALIVQEMVWGTVSGTESGQLTGAGNLFTRHPGTGKKELYGKFVPLGQGTDLTAGVRLPEDLKTLEKKAPKIYKALGGWADKCEAMFHDAQEIQFTLDGEGLKILEVKPSGRAPRASLRIALDLVAEGVCDERQGLRTIDPAGVEQMMHPELDRSSAEKPLTKGLPASPGSAVGKVVFFAEHAAELAEQGVETILVRHETTPEDIGGLSVASGILTKTGGLTSHAAVVARGMGKCCIVGASAMEINYHVNEMTIGGVTVKRHDWISLDGNTGEVFPGKMKQIQPTLEGDLAQVMKWADKHRVMGVRANADTEEDARRALEMGAEGIGLCRTEHMFFALDRIPIFRRMILALDEDGRSAALADLLPVQRKDFMDLFRVMDGRPVTIRLLDPPLNEFLPRGIRSQTRVSRAMNIPLETVQQRTEALSESNPMLGHRGCRLALTYPEIYQMQVRAIVEAACIVTKEGVPVDPEIMVPLVSVARELEILRREIEELTGRVMIELGENFPVRIGTMLETPRAALCSASIARHADFYSFGTNDLTQMGYGFSRDDSGSFLPLYLERKVLEYDPFMALDQEGIGAMIRIAIEEGRKTNAGLKVGICGEHGGESESVKFFSRLGLDYVSCSPFRVPIARMAAAQAAIEADEN